MAAKSAEEERVGRMAAPRASAVRATVSVDWCELIAPAPGAGQGRYVVQLWGEWSGPQSFRLRRSEPLPAQTYWLYRLGPGARWHDLLGEPNAAVRRGRMLLSRRRLMPGRGLTAAGRRTLAPDRHGALLASLFGEYLLGGLTLVGLGRAGTCVWLRQNSARSVAVDEGMVLSVQVEAAGQVHLTARPVYRFRERLSLAEAEPDPAAWPGARVLLLPAREQGTVVGTAARAAGTLPQVQFAPGVTAAVDPRSAVRLLAARQVQTRWRVAGWPAEELHLTDPAQLACDLSAALVRADAAALYEPLLAFPTAPAGYIL